MEQGNGQPSYLISIFNEAARLNPAAAKYVESEQPFSPDLICKRAWSPSLFSPKERAQPNFVLASVIGYDFDNGLSLQDAIAKFAASGFKHVIGTTKSHQIEKRGIVADRFRVVLFLNEPITKKEVYRATVLKLAADIGVLEFLDKNTAECARYFTPCKEIIVDAEGELAPLCEVFDSLVKTASVPNAKTKGNLSKRALTFIAGVWDQSNTTWHPEFFYTAMHLKARGHSIEEAEEILNKASLAIGNEGLDLTDKIQLTDVYNNRVPKEENTISWPKLIKLKEGGYVPHPTERENIKYAMQQLIGIKFRLHARSGILYYQESDDQDKDQVFSDSKLAVIKEQLRDYGLNPTTIEDYIQAEGLINKFDPLVEKLNSLQPVAQNAGHIQRLFETITLPEDTTVEARAAYALMLRRWLIGLVNKIYVPGSENNVLVFQGPQAAGKSRWLQKLGELWPAGYGEGHIVPDNKDHELRHLDNFLWHVAEFDSTTSRREVGALKDYFTKSQIRVRRPYDRYVTTGSSICSFCASVNSMDFLRDITGNRRYLVIPVEAVNPDHNINILDVFAEAKAAALAKEQYWFDRAEIERVNALNSLYVSTDELLGFLTDYCVEGDFPVRVGPLLEIVDPEHTLRGSRGTTKELRSSVINLLHKKRIKKRQNGSSVEFFIDLDVLQRALKTSNYFQVQNVTFKNKSLLDKLNGDSLIQTKGH